MTQPTQNKVFESSRISAAIVQSRVRVGRAANDCKKEASIKLNKNGSTVESIQITCTCGEEIVVKCVYQDETHGVQ